MPTVIADNRPNYSFSDEVFKELPEFPEDFFDVKDLFASQEITASQLGRSYYQPELIPSWDYWAEVVYTNGSKSFGNYGVFIYPSRFSVFNIDEGDTIELSMLIYAHLGIKFYQGVRLNFSEEETANIKLMYPESRDIILSPTAPYFRSGWMQLVEIQIDIKEKKNCTIEIMEENPSKQKDDEWRETYDNYTSSTGLLSQRVPRCKIYLYALEEPVEKETVYGNYIVYMIIFILAFILIGIYLYWSRHEKERRREGKQQKRT